MFLIYLWYFVMGFDWQSMLSFCTAKGRSLLILTKSVKKLREKQIVSQVPTKAYLTFQSTWEFIPQMVRQNLETYFLLYCWLSVMPVFNITDNLIWTLWTDRVTHFTQPFYMMPSKDTTWGQQRRQFLIIFHHFLTGWWSLVVRNYAVFLTGMLEETFVSHFIA